MNSKSKLIELFTVDLRSLAIMRIGIALIIIVDLIYRFSDISSLYSDEGILPRNTYVDYFDSWYFSIYLISGLPIVHAFLFLLTGFTAFLFLIGYRTRLINVVLWFLVSSLHMRNQFVLTGGDTLLCLLLFWGMFLPLGAYWSFDKKLFSKKENIPTQYFSLGVVALYLQVAFVYFFTALIKACPEWTKDGTAIFYALNIDQYITPAGILLRQFTGLLKPLTHSVFLYELIGPLLLFFPIFTGIVRTFTVFGFFLLQFGFWLCLTVGIFPFATTVAICVFLPSWFWDVFFVWLSKQFIFITIIKTQLRVLIDKYDKLIFNNRFITKLNSFFPTSKIIFKPSFISNITIVFFLFNVILWNIQSVEKFNYSMPEFLKRVSYFFNIHQSWVMFGPKTLKEDFWYVYPGFLKNGEYVDVFSDPVNGKKLVWERPVNSSGMYKDHRWRTYIRNLWSSKNTLYPPYAQHICHSWNKTHSPDKELTYIDFYYAREETLLNNMLSKPTYGWMYRHKCY